MTKRYSQDGYFLHAAFFAVVPHGSEFERFHYDILLTLALFGPLPAQGCYQKLYEYKRLQWLSDVQKRIKWMTANNYLTKQGTKYHLTDRSMLLIAQVERKLKKLVEEHAGANPVGRPDEGKGYGRKAGRK